MDLSVATVAETLSYEFAELPLGSVIGVLTGCVDEYPHADSHFIEQAARARLLLLAHPQRGGSKIGGNDALDVSLHDRELAVEVELTVSLMIAVNESEHPLAEEDVDRILGVRPGERVIAGATLPSQRNRCHPR